MNTVPEVAPASTYRVQLNADFTLFDAAQLVEYLAELGIGAVYCSPIFQAAAGSLHGYDIVDHRTIDRTRGGSEGLTALADAARAHSMTLVLDIVPNHMGVADASENEQWAALLRTGRCGPAAPWFDVDWAWGRGRVALPVLSPDFDAARDLTVSDGSLQYQDLRFPLCGVASEDPPLDEVLPAQHYELVDGGGAEVNYRRFFAVSQLAGIRVEDPSVFSATHELLAKLVDSDFQVSGLRIDHPDGLADPTGYLERLASLMPSSWIVVEKILATGEDLPTAWSVAGTTGYDALSEVSALMIDPDTKPLLDRIYRDLTGDEHSWAQHARDGKRHVMRTILEPEVLRIARLAPAHPDAADSIIELAAAYDVYRSYAPLGEEHLRKAAKEVGMDRPDLRDSIDGLLPRLRDPADELCVRFQQLTSAVMAKGVEDTAFYRYSRFVALNEVGGDPERVGCEVDDFHLLQADRVERVPRSMTTLSTHDTKRGEDVRARLFVISELAEEWRAVVTLLFEQAPISNRSFSYLFWQTVVGVGQISRDRLHAVAEKSMREASEETSWEVPNADFEAAVHAAVDACYDEPTVARLIASFSARLEPFGWSNSLSQKLVQLTMPGVPDCYQGSETGEFSLVDPDNRRPIDFAERARRLRMATSSQDWPQRKLAVCAAALRARRDRPELFGSYSPVTAAGDAGKHLVAFDRGGAITFATRLPVGLTDRGGWGSTTVELPYGTYRDAVSGRTFAGTVGAGDLLRDLPVALLLEKGA